jgi:hypothetical protein
MASFSAIPFDDIKLFCNKNKIRYNYRDEAYFLAWTHIAENKKCCFIPTSISDWVLAYNNPGTNLPIIKLSELDNNLKTLSEIYGTNDKKRIIRILGYLHKLENDLIFCCDDICGNILSNFNYSQILSMKRVCKYFNTFCQNNKDKMKIIISNELSRFIHIKPSYDLSKIERIYKRTVFRPNNKTVSTGYCYSYNSRSNHTLAIDKSGKLYSSYEVVPGTEQYNFVNIISTGHNVYLLDINGCIYKFVFHGVTKFYEGATKIFECHGSICIVTENGKYITPTHNGIIVHDYMNIADISVEGYCTFILHINGKVSLNSNEILDCNNIVSILCGIEYSLTINNDNKAYSVLHKNKKVTFLKYDIKQLFKDRRCYLYMLSYDGIINILHSETKVFALNTPFKTKRILGDTYTSLIILDTKDNIFLYDTTSKMREPFYIENF